MKTLNTISECEEIIMMCIWNSPDKLNCVELEAILRMKYGKCWRLQTICTFLTRLVSKNYIYSARDGRYTYYFPIISKEEYQQYVTQKLLLNVFDNDKQQLLLILNQLEKTEESDG